MATAKKAAPAKASKKTAAAEAVDDILEGKTDDVLEGKAEKKAKGGKAAAAPAKGKAAKAAAKAEKPAKAKKEKAEGGTRGANTEAVRAAVSKVRKSTSYADLAEAGGFDIRLVRRTARSMRDEGVIELEKEGTVVFIKPAAKAK
jgi:DNA-binding transcriptional ArsR family regulator